MILKSLAALLAFACTLPAQHILYNQKQDQTGQDAVTAAKQITSGAVFDAMAANLNMQAREETDTALAYSREIMRANLMSVQVWAPSAQFPDATATGIPVCKSLGCKLKSLEDTLNSGSLLDSPNDPITAAQRLAEIEQKEKDLKTAIEQLKNRKPNEPAVVELLSHLGDVKDLVAFATTINKDLSNNKGFGKSLGEISAGLDQMISLYNSVKSIWADEKAVEVDPASLRPAPELIQLQMLQLEEQSIQHLTRIRATQHLEAGDALSEITSARQFLQGQLDSPDTIEETLRADTEKAAASTKAGAPTAAADRDRLRLTLQGLLEASAAFAMNDSATRLELIREGDEYRLYNIRRNALNATTYDQTIQAAVQRLAAYYKGGIKATDIAGLIFYITNSVAVPAIAAK